MRSASGGNARDGARVRGGTTSSVRCFDSTLIGDGASNGGSPVSTRYNVAPRL